MTEQTKIVRNVQKYRFDLVKYIQERSQIEFDVLKKYRVHQLEELMQKIFKERVQLFLKQNLLKKFAKSIKMSFHTQTQQTIQQLKQTIFEKNQQIAYLLQQIQPQQTNKPIRNIDDDCSPRQVCEQKTCQQSKIKQNTNNTLQTLSYSQVKKLSRHKMKQIINKQQQYIQEGKFKRLFPLKSVFTT